MKKLYTFFIDHSQAFNYNVRDNLWYKLLNLGVREKIIDIIRLCIDKYGPTCLTTMKSLKHSRVN